MSTESSRPIHPLAVRAMHWINALAVLVMVGSGLEIHNAYPIAPFDFPDWMTIGGWLGGALLWHFAAMWLFAANLVAMIGFGLLSGRYRRKLLPLSPRGFVADLRAALRGGGLHADPARYNGVQRVLYAGVLAALVVLVLSGLALWKPVQLHGLAWLFGGFDFARIVHFAAMVAVVGFVLVHVAMALLVPRTLRLMTLGR
ncbi:MAG: cytochrome b/b6 domain-containing protein [Alphaproteobacteria bacterium]